MLLYVIVSVMLLAVPAVWLSFGAPGWQLAALILACFAGAIVVVWIEFDVPGALILSAIPFSVLVPTVGSTIIAGLGPRIPRTSPGTGTSGTDRSA